MDSEQDAGMALAHTRYLETRPRGAEDEEDPGFKSGRPWGSDRMEKGFVLEVWGGYYFLEQRVSMLSV